MNALFLFVASQVQFVRFFGTDEDVPGHYLFATISKEIEADEGLAMGLNC
jgi:hypothetical protein